MIFKISILKFTTWVIMKSISIIEMLLQMSSNVTLIASNLGARDVIVHFEIVFILFFYLPFCRLSILKPGATLLKCGFSKFPHVRTIIFWDHIFPRISLVNFEPLAKVIYSMYSKHWPYFLAFTMDYGYSKILNHGFNHRIFLWKFRIKI